MNDGMEMANPDGDEEEVDEVYNQILEEQGLEILPETGQAVPSSKKFAEEEKNMGEDVNDLEARLAALKN